MKIDQSTYCGAAWFNVRHQRNGTFAPCCYIDFSLSDFEGAKDYHSVQDWMNSDYALYIKQNLTSGTKLKECKDCWNKEQSGIISGRQSSNALINLQKPFDQSWTSQYFKNKQDFQNDLIVSADIKTTNICNFSCAMCIPEDSSKIASIYHKNQDHPIVQGYTEQYQDRMAQVDLIYRDGHSYNTLREVLAKNPKNLRLLGGEPLLDKQLISILKDNKNKEKVHLTFITNGSVCLNTVVDELRDYKGVNFVISLESIGQVQDYIRRGSQWHQIETNILNYILKHSSKQLSINHTLQPLTFYHVSDLVQWASRHNISLNISKLTKPNYLSFDIMSTDLLDIFCNKILQSSISDGTGLTIDGKNNHKITSASLVSLVKKDHCYDPALVYKFKDFLNWYDPSSKWKQVLPEWLSYLT